MGKIRYYCEYCDRSFLDDLDVRKKHLTGTLHIRQRKLFYNKFRDAKTILEEEGNAEQCKRYINYNNCPFGDNCKYSHYSQADFESLRQQVHREEAIKTHAQSVEAALEKIPSVDKLNSWLSLRLQSTKVEGSGQSVFTDLVNNLGSSPAIKGYINLPPSLQPWTASGSEIKTFSEWG